ncbi:MAG: XdhC/CoxF family protein, partial [Eubacteriaceae bacterium]|nr:XdhC/CoxF family protein [Eubacteriaceae bacterium]
YIIIATYGHEYDYEVLDSLYKKPCNPAYIGLLSSKVKVEQTIGRFADRKGAQVNLKNLYTPAGLDIGGSTPDEIAVSIISQMQAVRYNKKGHKHLREEWYLSK